MRQDDHSETSVYLRVVRWKIFIGLTLAPIAIGVMSFANGDYSSIWGVIKIVAGVILVMCGFAYAASHRDKI